MDMAIAKEEALNDVYKAEGPGEHLVPHMCDLFTHLSTSARRQMDQYNNLETAMDLLVRGERWLEHYEHLLGTKNARLPAVQRCCANVLGGLSQCQAKLAQFDTALRYATRAFAIEKKLDDTTPVQLATTSLQICALNSKLKKHPTALKHAGRAVNLLGSVYVQQLRSGSPPGSANADGGTQPADDVVEEKNVGSLLAVTLYNKGVEELHIGDNDAAKGTLTEALRLGKLHLREGHPLLNQLYQLLQGWQVKHDVTNVRVHARGSAPGSSAANRRPETVGSSPPVSRELNSVAADRAAIHNIDALAPPSVSGSVPSSRGHQHQRPVHLHSHVQLSPSPRGPPFTESGAQRPLTVISQVDRVVEQPRATGSGAGHRNAAMHHAGVSSNRRPVPRASPGAVSSTTGSLATSKSQRHAQKTLSSRPTEFQPPQKKEFGPEQLKLLGAMSTMGLQVENRLRQRRDAALRIQCAWRCSLARLEAHNRRQVLYHYLHAAQKAAVKCLLSNYSTFRQRQAMLRTVERRKVETKERAVRELEEDRAATRIGRSFRSYCRRLADRDAMLARLEQERQEKKLRENDAATTIQQWWPRTIASKRYWRRRNVEVQEEKLLAQEMKRKGAAANEIQRVYRGWLDRNFVTRYRQRRAREQEVLRNAVHYAIDAIRIVLKEHRARLERPKIQEEIDNRNRKAAVDKIGTEWTQVLERRAVQALNRRVHRMNNAAFVLQRFLKRCYALRELRVMRKVHVAAAERRNMREWHRDRAACTVQRTMRRFLARRTVRRVRAARGRTVASALFLLRRVFSGYICRDRFQQLRLARRKYVEDAVVAYIDGRRVAATKIQARARGMLTRRRVQQISHEAAAEKARIQEEAYMALLQDRAAAKIQGLGRIVYARAVVARRRRDLRGTSAWIVAAAERIQRFTRVVLAKKCVRAQRLLVQKDKDKAILALEVHDALLLMYAEELGSMECRLRAQMEETETEEREYVVSKIQRWLNGSRASSRTQTPLAERASGRTSSCDIESSDIYDE